MLRIVAIAAGLLVAAVALRAEDEPPVINWDDAEQHVGEDVIVKGRVVGVHCSPTSCLLAFEPTFNRFTAVVQAERFDLFPPARLDDQYSGKRVQVHGTIVQNDKKPEIVVSNLGDLRLAGVERRQEHQEQDGSARQQADVLDRMAAVLDQLVALTERMAATQERTEAVLAQLEQRAGMLAAAQPPPPPGPSWGEPQPRPGYEALRTIKRGMKPNDVERLIGKPEYVEYGAGGWSTWYYGFGRSVSFDARGRAQGMVGFPNP